MRNFIAAFTSIILFIVLMVGIWLETLPQVPEHPMRDFEGSWTAIPLRSSIPVADPTTVKFTFITNGGFSGTDECNTFGGGFLVDGNQFKLDGYVSTTAWCHEGDPFRHLAFMGITCREWVTFQRTENTLIFTDEMGHLLMVLNADP